MLVDLNVKGKRVLIFGGGREATRKIEALLYQECQIEVVTEAATEIIQQWASGKRLNLKLESAEEYELLSGSNWYLVMAATDDSILNRKLAESARGLNCFVYCVDDPDFSDFNHPSVINVRDEVQVAISTQGKSPLMARTLRERLEPELKARITEKDARMIQLQARLRPIAKTRLASPEERKRYLEEILVDPEILECLTRNKLDEAETLALSRLDK